MSKRRISIAGIVTCLLFISNSIWAQTNLALDAKIATSHVSPWEVLDAINDDYTPTSSMDKGPGAYGNWEGEANYNTWNWVEYTFFSESQVDSVRVYWWTDGGGILAPNDTYVEVFENGEFTNVGSIGHDLDKYNSLAINKTTAKIRINMKSDAATGILELQVFGTEGKRAELMPYIQVNGGEKISESQVTVEKGDQVVLSCDLDGELLKGGTWSGPKGLTSSDSVLVIESFETSMAGAYIYSYITPSGFDIEQTFYVLMKIEPGASYEWASYNPTLDYNFRDEYPDLEMPTKNSQDCDPSLVAGEISKDWWTFVYGHKKNELIRDETIESMLDYFNEEFAYIRDTMGWPPDKRAKDGYRSAIYLFGSGLCTDAASNTDLGGWMGSVNGYPMVLASYYPVYCFDPECDWSDRGYQMGGMIHEGIHAILADMPGCKDACWFQEGGNTWLQQEMAVRRSGEYTSMGGLNGCTFLAPFMPIECYSGWLQDGSFGGPCAQGVNKFNGNQQICTWRSYLGGNQYGNSFPTFLAQILGKGSIPWIWRNCEGLVLEGMSETLGDAQMRRLLTEYRAKQALIDMNEWHTALRNILDGAFNMRIGSEWQPAWINPDVWVATPYARTTMDDAGVLTPEYRTTPGWSGANQIPLKVKGDSVYINFQPVSKEGNMTCLIAYRDIFGNPVYSAPVTEGDCTIKLMSPAANDVVIAVITNTDYVYEGEETRKAHFDYRIQIDTTLTVPAHTHKRWYAWDDNPDNDVIPDLPAISPADTLAPSDIIFEQEEGFKENNWIGKSVGTFSTVDQTPVKEFSYKLVDGEGDTDNSRFRMSGEKLQAKEVFDYEFSPTYSIRVSSTNVNNKAFEKSFIVEIENVVETTVDEATFYENVELFPNPVRDVVFLKSKGDAPIQSIQILNQKGALVKEITNIDSNDIAIHRDNIVPGVYFVKVSAGETYCTKVLFQ